VCVLLRGRVIARANAFPTVARRPAGAYITPVPPILCARGPLRLVLSSRNPRVSAAAAADCQQPSPIPQTRPTPPGRTDLCAARRIITIRLYAYNTRAHCRQRCLVDNINYFIAYTHDNSAADEIILYAIIIITSHNDIIKLNIIVGRTTTWV